MKHTRISYELVDNYIADNINSEVEQIKNPVLSQLVSMNLTKTQKCYIMLYYKDRLTMQQIAEKCGVSKSTVSRTISRGRNRLLDGAKRTALSRIINERT